MLLSALLHALWNTVQKGSKSPLAYLLTMQIVSAVAAIGVLPFFVWSEISTEVWLLMAATALAHGFYSYWLSLSYQHGDLSVVYPIARTTPAFVPLLAIPLLGERVSLAGGGGILLVVAGMWLVQTEGRLRARDFRTAAAGFAYLTLLSTVIYSLIDKQAMHLLESDAWTGPAPRSVVYFLLLAAGHTPVFGALAWRRLPAGALRRVVRDQRGGVLAGALASFASYTLILEALRTAPVSYVVAVRQTSVIFAVLLAVGWLGERPGPMRVLGSLATVLGVALIALRA